MARVITKLFNSYLFCFMLSIGNTKSSAKFYREKERHVGYLLFCKFTIGLTKCILLCHGGQHHQSFLQDRKQCCCYDAKEIHGKKRKIWQGLLNFLFAGDSNDYYYILTKLAKQEWLGRITLLKRFELKSSSSKGFQSRIILIKMNKSAVTCNLFTLTKRKSIKNFFVYAASILLHINALLHFNVFLCSVALENFKPKDNIDMTQDV